MAIFLRCRKREMPEKSLNFIILRGGKMEELLGVLFVGYVAYLMFNELVGEL